MTEVVGNCTACEQEKKRQAALKEQNKEVKKLTEQNLVLSIETEVKKFISSKIAEFNKEGKFLSKYSKGVFPSFSGITNTTQLYTYILYSTGSDKYIGIVYIIKINDKLVPTGLAIKNTGGNLSLPFLETKYYNNPLTYNQSYQTF